MPSMSFWRRPVPDEERRATTAEPAQASASTIPIRDAERRRLSRLLARRAGVEYDLAQAQTAFMPQNRWTERIEQLDDAIRQAHDDMERLKPPPSGVPHVQLPAHPIEIDVRSVDVPAEILILAGGEAFLFREELDWSELGHQVALPKLQQVGGDAETIVPGNIPADARRRLAHHVRNGLSIIANDALKRAAGGEPIGSFTLADFTRPCEECGGWLDPLGRCPACAELDWQRNQIAAAAARLTDERNDTFADMDRARERLPVLRRQLQDVDKDIKELRAKGVEPE